MEQEEEGGDSGEEGGSEGESKEMEEEDGSGSGDEVISGGRFTSWSLKELLCFSQDDVLSSDDSESEGEGEGEEGVDPAFRAEIRKALGAAAVDSEGEVSACS